MRGPLPAADYHLVIDPPACREGHLPPARTSLLHYAWHARLSYAAAEWAYYPGNKLRRFRMRN